MREGDPVSGRYADEATRYALADYLREYGVDFRDLSNYLLNDQTILSAELLSVRDGIYTYAYEIDPTVGAAGYGANMQRMGGLSKPPVLSHCRLTVEMTADFLPVSVTHEDEYTIDFILQLNCSSVLTERFARVGDPAVSLPDADFFAAQSARRTAEP